MKALLSAVLIVLATPAAAAPVVTEHARSELIAETDGVAAGETINLAFAQELQEGWHVYWKNPGDSGLPLEFIWTLPPGASADGIDYPAPHRIPIGPLVNFGHKGAPVFLTSVTAPQDAVVGTFLEIGLEATWLICADICVPETGVFALAVPVVSSPQKNESASDIFARARAASPSPLEGDAFFSVHGENIVLRTPSLTSEKNAYFFPALAGASEPAAPQKAKTGKDGLTLTIKGGSALASIEGSLDGVIAVDGEGGPKSYSLSAAREERSAAAKADEGSLAGFLLAAFLGGAILNLMPCVFPILFVKAASMAKAASGDRAAMRRHGLLYGAGVVAAFAALGGLLLALRAGGQEIGWGFHLQTPAVIALSAYVLFAVGLNFAGVFHIGSSLQNVGSDIIARNEGDLSAFLTGVLAVFVAAPCVGPFLTAPIGAAAVLPPLAGFSIFIAMAAGLSAPFVALSFAPGIAGKLPRPGPWMVRFRQVLSFPVFAAAAYFIWVLSAQTGQRGLALGIGGLLLVALAAQLWEWGRSAAWAKAAAVALLLVSLWPVAMMKPAEAAAITGAISFEPADVEARRAAGEPVFIDFTAAWCVTCQVNKLTVLSNPQVKAAFAEEGVAFVTADWTNRDPVIERALGEFGANGVPLYVFYPQGGEALILPQPLTVDAVVSTIRSPAEGD